MAAAGWIIGIVSILVLAWMIWYFRRNAIESFSTAAPFEKMEATLVNTIQEAGWKLLSMHDIQARLVGAGFDVKRIAVYEICRPDYAAAVLEKDTNKRFSALMPCRISIYEMQDGTTGMSMINADLLATLFGGVVKRIMGKAASESEIIIHKAIKTAEHE
ncbi:MAG TPA: DUF302 domain-containing protein [Bacteroidales bacterium]|nr:DUF302 domain-containing protein [Bacteroidales bacterium]HRZ50010.1 DUF302 domain-containing protein [Bacteroidales bacterium]